MGPAVSRPDDAPSAGPPSAPGQASMGPAVSRPDDLARFQIATGETSSFNGAGRFTAG